MDCLILTPFVLSLWPPLPPLTDDRIRFRWYDAVAIALSLLIVIPFALSHQRMFHGVMMRPFLLLPPAPYAAARFSIRTTTAAVVGLAASITDALTGIINRRALFDPAARGRAPISSRCASRSARRTAACA